MKQNKYTDIDEKFIMRVMIFIIVFIFNLLNARSQEDECIILNEKIGDLIDQEERIQYNLFPARKGFQSAVLYKSSD